MDGRLLIAKYNAEHGIKKLHGNARQLTAGLHGKKETGEATPIICPDCGAKLYPAEGCAICPVCGYSPCQAN